ncbi:hypothetical protein GCM10018790_51200 [Kitasatospora xanthocidica]|uniref:hypothetical protein n=1 Tax=Kitasatospora xanthocidica TaxID=83382 RepID=UPI00167B6897|nr:hypothetical protein [Kitasatospora xanthocidica]GHF67017.1 hypothetical protein GCM10018790_51200 [Kitasatospora xanthocidica]
MPDHFDRLVAKGGPGGDRAGVRVRPRLPGPFERPDALAPAPPVVDEESFGPGRSGGRPAPAPLPRPSAAPPAAPVERALRAVAGEDRPSLAPVLPLPRRPLLIAPPVTPVAAPVVEPTVRREAARPAVVPTPVTAPHRATAPGPPTVAPPAAVRPAAASASVRRAAGAAAPGQAHGTGSRRRQQPVERVVRVQIGRVEVRASQPTPAGPRKPAAARPGPALDLDKYLDRETS